MAWTSVLRLFFYTIGYALMICNHRTVHQVHLGAKLNQVGFDK